MRARRCWYCGSGALRQDIDGDLACMLCARPAVQPMTLADAARLVGVSVRTVRRWVDSRQVLAEPSHGRGLPRLVDTADVLLVVRRRNTMTPTCEWCGALIEAPGISRGRVVTRRWCSGRRKGADANQRRRHPTPRASEAHQGGAERAAMDGGPRVLRILSTTPGLLHTYYSIDTKNCGTRGPSTWRLPPETAASPQFGAAHQTSELALGGPTRWSKSQQVGLRGLYTVPPSSYRWHCSPFRSGEVSLDGWQ